MLLTGLHVVADIYCKVCESRLGWKYVRGAPAALCASPLFGPSAALPLAPAQLAAYEEEQKYKEGKFILERVMILREEGSVSSPFKEVDVDEVHQ